jgi:TPR repeat protein
MTRTRLAAPLVLTAAVAAGAQPAVDLRLVEAIGWYTGTRGVVDEAKARTLIETSAFEGNVLARMWLARLYSRGRAGYPRDAARAQAIAETLVDAVRRQALAGTTEAVFLMGTACDEGLGVAEDPAAAFEWFTKAATAGHTLAEHNLGNAYAAGRGVVADPAQAAAWWLKAAIKGDAIPQLRLGEAYEAGHGVAKSLDEARRWYGESALRGNAAAAAAVKRLAGGD